MLKKLLLLLTLIISFSIYSQSIYQEFDVWSLSVDANTLVSLKAYITIDSVLDIDNEYNYIYDFNVISLSMIDNEHTITWLYGTRIFINEIPVSNERYPDGFIIGINNTPTSVYKYSTTETKIKFAITWDNAVADPRTRN